MTQYAISGRANNFHLIRHCAAVAVLLTHSYYVVGGRYADEPLVRFLHHSIGNYAVDVFFLLSGFLLAQSLARNESLLGYAVSRALRIAPALLATVLATSLILGPIVSELPASEYFGDPRLLQYILGAGSSLWTSAPLPGVFDMAPVASAMNVSIWTIKYEIAAYAMLAALVLLGRLSSGRIWVPVAACLAAAYIVGRMALPWPETHGSITSNLLHFLLYFGLGACVFVFRRHIPLTLSGLAMLSLAAIATHPSAAREFFEAAAIAYGVFWLAFLRAPFFLPASCSVDCSYGLYLLGFPIQQAIRQALPSIEPLELFFLSLAVTLPAAVLSWCLIEKPGLACRAALTRWLSAVILPNPTPPPPRAVKYSNGA